MLNSKKKGGAGSGNGGSGSGGSGSASRICLIEGTPGKYTKRQVPPVIPSYNTSVLFPKTKSSRMSGLSKSVERLSSLFIGSPPSSNYLKQSYRDESATFHKPVTNTASWNAVSDGHRCSAALPPSFQQSLSFDNKLRVSSTPYFAAAATSAATAAATTTTVAGHPTYFSRFQNTFVGSDCSSPDIAGMFSVTTNAQTSGILADAGSFASLNYTGLSEALPSAPSSGCRSCHMAYGPRSLEALPSVGQSLSPGRTETNLFSGYLVNSGHRVSTGDMGGHGGGGGSCLWDDGVSKDSVRPSWENVISVGGYGEPRHFHLQPVEHQHQIAIDNVASSSVYSLPQSDSPPQVLSDFYALLAGGQQCTNASAESGNEEGGVDGPTSSSGSYSVQDIPTWLRIYSKAPSKLDHLLKWDVFRLPQLVYFDNILLKLYKQEIISIVAAYERYRFALTNEIERRKNATSAVSLDQPDF